MKSNDPILKDVSQIVLQKDYEELTNEELDELCEFFVTMCGEPGKFRHMDLLPELWDDWKSK